MLHGMILFVRGIRLGNRKTGYIGVFTSSGAFSMFMLSNLVLDYMGTRKEPEVLILSFGMCFLFVISGGFFVFKGLSKYFKSYAKNASYKDQISGVVEALLGNAIAFIGCTFITGL